ncbi:D-cysteine desulfhydrase family protein [Nisaea denitrificans]|uniref:D-cysteine desulfhydrase family protein n=1 Tax=Nisaea denitrificans TaxID=390877 RepID=UPI000417D21C|nr:D-cysteine desulfhydrase family protein [Nisaea denitrificans]
MMTGPDALQHRLNGFPRVRLGHFPTPLEKMDRLAGHLSEELGKQVPSLWVKRDDCSGLATGGNKVRQLEYSFGAAQAAGADTAVITGAVQSNYMRTAAAFAAKLGMECHVQLENRVEGMGEEYHKSGNVLLDRMFGARMHHFPLGEDEKAADTNLSRIAGRLKREGKKPYLFTLSADSKPTGSLGYMQCAVELLQQSAANDMQFDAVVVPSGSAATHVGTLLGLRLAGYTGPVHGICVRRDAKSQTERVLSITRLAEDMLGCGEIVPESDVICRDDWLGPSYGKMVESTHEAIDLAGRLEALIVDPVYTAKSLAGLIGLTRAGAFEGMGSVLYIHTGGLPALFAYRSALYPGG